MARHTGGISSFGIGDGGLTMETPFAEAAAWVAEVVQDNLAGYDFVQWPSRGRHLLLPRLRDGRPVWIDPHGDVIVSPHRPTVQTRRPVATPRSDFRGGHAADVHTTANTRVLGALGLRVDWNAGLVALLYRPEVCLVCAGGRAFVVGHIWIR